MESLPRDVISEIATHAKGKTLSALPCTSQSMETNEKLFWAVWRCQDLRLEIHMCLWRDIMWRRIWSHLDSQRKQLQPVPIVILKRCLCGNPRGITDCYNCRGFFETGGPILPTFIHCTRILEIIPSKWGVMAAYSYHKLWEHPLPYPKVQYSLYFEDKPEPGKDMRGLIYN